MGCALLGCAIGAAAAGGLTAAPALVVAGITWAYITSVTVLARGETSDARPGLSAFVPSGIILAGAILMVGVWLPRRPGAIFMIVVPFSLGLSHITHAIGRMRRSQIRVAAFIGTLLRVTIAFQTGWALWRCSGLRADAWAILLAGTTLLACSELASRKFYGS